MSVIESAKIRDQKFLHDITEVLKSDNPLLSQLKIQLKTDIDEIKKLMEESYLINDLGKYIDKRKIIVSKILDTQWKTELAINTIKSQALSDLKNTLDELQKSIKR